MQPSPEDDVRPLDARWWAGDVQVSLKDVQVSPRGMTGFHTCTAEKGLGGSGKLLDPGVAKIRES